MTDEETRELNLHTIAALRAILETVDRLGQQIDDAPLSHDTWAMAQSTIDDMRSIIVAELAPLEQRLFTPHPRTPNR